LLSHLTFAHLTYKMTRLLMDRGADTNARTPDQDTPLSLAQKLGNKEVIELLTLSGSSSST